MIGNNIIPAEVFVIAEYLKNNQYFKTIKDIDLFSRKIFDTYHKNCSVIDELKKMDVWLIANPTRHKKNYARFIVNWLNKKGLQK